MNSNEQLNQIIQEELEAWADYTMRMLAAELQRRKLVLSGDLLKSLQYSILKSASEAVGVAQILFDDSGRFKDMRKVQWRNAPRNNQSPSIVAYEAFIKEIGLSKFEYVPGYVKGKKVPTESQAINRIAWGIAMGKFRSSKHTPKPWFNKKFYSAINTLIFRMSERIQQESGQIVGFQLKDLN